MHKLVMLRKTDEFSSVFSFRKRFSSSFLVVHYKSSLDKTSANEIAADNFVLDTQVKIGFIVAKKVAKLAVDRNYMRRVLRELCRQELYVLAGEDLASINIVIQVQKKFINSDFLTIKQELMLLFAKIQKKLVAKY